MSINYMKIRVPVSEDLKEVCSSIPHHRGWSPTESPEVLFFETQKHLDDRIIRLCKNYQYNNRKSNFSIDAFIQMIQDYAKDKMVVEINDATFIQDVKRSYKPEQIQSAYENLCRTTLINSFAINSLMYYYFISLRKVVIQSYYKESIATLLTRDIKNKTHNDIFKVEHAGWGFLGSFKPKLLCEWPEKDLYWVKTLYSKELEELMRASMLHDSGKLYVDLVDNRNSGSYSHTQNTRFINVVTSDKAQVDLFELLVPEESKVFTTNLNPLRNLLVKYNLLNAIENKFEFTKKNKVD